MPCETPDCGKPLYYASKRFCIGCHRAANGLKDSSPPTSGSGGGSHSSAKKSTNWRSSSTSSSSTPVAASSSSVDAPPAPSPAMILLTRSQVISCTKEFLLVGSDNITSSYLSPVLESLLSAKTLIPNCLAHDLTKGDVIGTWSWPANEKWLRGALLEPGLRACFVRNDYCEPALPEGENVTVDEFRTAYAKIRSTEGYTFTEVVMILEAGYTQVTKTTYGSRPMTRLEKPAPVSDSSSSSSSHLPSTSLSSSPSRSSGQGPLIAPGEGPGFLSSAPNPPKEEKQ